MAYQNVGTPRFYINCIEWMHSLGLVNNPWSLGIDRYLTTSASNPTYFIPGYDSETAVKGDGDNDTMGLPRLGAPGGTTYIPYNKIMQTKSFIAFLGHNLRSADCEMLIQEGSPNYTSIWDVEEIINWGDAGGHCKPSYDGFSIATCNLSHFDQIGNVNHIRYESSAENDTWNDGEPDSNWDPETLTGSYAGLNGVTIGAIVFGTYYDMPHSPDLNITMTREMDGVKRIRTKGGADLVNHKYTKPAVWGKNTDEWLDTYPSAAWELHDPGLFVLTGDNPDTEEVDWGYVFGYQHYYPFPKNHAYSRIGRRVWDLSFSYLKDSDMFSPIEHQGGRMLDNTPYPGGVNSYGEEVWYESSGSYWHDNQNILTHDSFYSQVIHRTNGGQLPFIFQPDSSNNNPDGFAICKLDMKEFAFERVTKNIYNIKLKIREVW